MVMYTFFLFVKKEKFTDLLFEMKSDKIAASAFISTKIKLLEKKQDQKALLVTRKIGQVLSKKTTVEIKVDQVKQLVINYYFDKFKNRFCGFKKSDWALRILLLWSGIGGFLFFGNIIYDLAYQNDLSNQEIFPLILLSSLLLFIVPLCFGLIWTFMIYAWFGIIKTCMHSLGLKTGIFNKTQQHIEAHILAFKPGGRNTVVSFSGIQI